MAGTNKPASASRVESATAAAASPAITGTICASAPPLGLPGHQFDRPRRRPGHGRRMRGRKNPGPGLVPQPLDQAAVAGHEATGGAQRLGERAHADVDAVVASGRLDGLAPSLELDHGRVIVVGHSYGGWTAVVSAIEHAPAIRGAVGLQPFTRSVSRDDLARAAVPVLLVAAGADATTPPALDSHPAFEVLGAPSVDLVEFAEAGHQACSDVGLYVELLPEVDGLPELVSDLVGGMAADVTGRAGDPWRPVVALHLELVVAWADAVLVGADTAAAVDPFAARPGVDVRSRRR